MPVGGRGGEGGADWTRRLIRNVNKHTWILDGGSWVKSRVTSWVKNVEKEIAVKPPFRSLKYTKPPGPIHPFFFRTKTINALFTKLSTNDLSFLSILLIKIMCGVVYPGRRLFHVSGYWIYIVLYLEWHHLILQVLQLFPFLLEFFAYYISPPL